MNTTSRYRPVLATQADGQLAAIADFKFNLRAKMLASDSPMFGSQVHFVSCFQDS